VFHSRGIGGHGRVSQIRSRCVGGGEVQAGSVDGGIWAESGGGIRDGSDNGELYVTNSEDEAGKVVPNPEEEEEQECVYVPGSEEEGH
jgi:hypothetical protein